MLIDCFVGPREAVVLDPNLYPGGVVLRTSRKKDDLGTVMEGDPTGVFGANDWLPPFHVVQSGHRFHEYVSLTDVSDVLERMENQGEARFCVRSYNASFFSVVLVRYSDQWVLELEEGSVPFQIPLPGFNPEARITAPHDEPGDTDKPGRAIWDRLNEDDG